MFPISFSSTCKLGFVALCIVFTGCTSKARQLKTDNQMLQQRVFQYQQDYAAMEFEQQRLSTERDEFQNKVSSLESEISVLKDRISSMQNLMTTQQKQQAQAMVQGIESRVEEQNQLKLQLESALAKLEIVNNDLALAQSQLAERDEQIKSLEAVNTSTQTNLKTLGENSEVLLAERDSARSERDDFRRQLRAMESTSEEASQQMTELSNNLRDKEKEISALTRDLEASKQLTAQYEAESAKKSANRDAINQALQASLMTLQNENKLELDLTNDPKIIMLSDNLFQPGTVLLTEDARQKLNIVASAIAGIQGIETIRIEGHTDSDPVKNMPFVDNWDLAAARAATVTRMLSSTQGIPSRKLQAVSKAFFDPNGSNDSSEGKRKNRRVEIILIPEG